jgi:hypothetical protein
MKLFNALFATAAWADNFQTGPQHILPELSNSNACGWWDVGAPLASRINQDRILNPDRLIDPDRIINGDDVAHGSWPWIVGFTENGQRVCSGTIIHDRWIISAEHCFPALIAPRDSFVMTAEDFPAVAWTKMYFGDHNKRVPEDSEFFLHPQKLVFRENRSPTGNRRDTRAADIVMIQVESITAKLSQLPASVGYVKPACLPSVAMDAQDPFAGQHCWIAGWGYTRFGETWWGGVGGSRLASTLQEAGINIFSNQYCADHSHMTLVDKLEDVTTSAQLQTYNEFCAGIADNDGDGKIDGDIDACSGDSGGPLICDVNGTPTLVGITSRGKGCAMEDNPGVYTPTWPFYSWIDNIVRTMTDAGPVGPEPADPAPTNGDDDDTLSLSDRALMLLAEGCTLEATCIKSNGSPNTGKTAAQKRNRDKKIGQFEKAMEKYVGEKKKSTKCADKNAPMPSVNDVFNLDDEINNIEDAVAAIAQSENCYAVLEDAVEKCIEATYGTCKPVANWIRGTKKKANALKLWGTKAEKGGCSLA